MASTSKVASDIVIGRLPLYLRTLTYLLAEGRQITSSQELSDRLGISPAQIRKDLSHFGEFGKQGTGYDIQFLHQQLQCILNLEHEWQVALVGAGDLGQALARYGGFVGTGFRIATVFDHDSQKIGVRLGELEVLDAATMPAVIRDRGIRVAIIAVPASDAQGVTNTLIECGVRAILSYAPITLSVPPSVQVQYLDPLVHLQRMTYYLT